MSLIERYFPIEELNTVALGEGNSKKPVYRMHKWWARRLGSVFRAILITAFTDNNVSESSVWHKFCNGADLDGKVILDPFMGGGTTMVEALRIGAKVVGVDINPVAWFVTKKEVEPVDLNALDIAFRELEQTAGEKIKEYYRTTCPKGHSADVMYYFWVKVADCVKCGTRVRLFPNYELSRRDHTNVSICPKCLQIIETTGYNPSTMCSECGTSFDPHHGISARGVFCCPVCSEEQKHLDAIRRKGSALEVELHALEGHCDTCGRFFKRIDKDDVFRLEKVIEEFDSCKETLPFPRQAIPTKGRSDPRPVNHGYIHFWQMFNERQLLSLSILLEQILRIPDQNIRELMLTAFSDCLNTNNMFCKYEVEWHKISLFFSLHAFHPIERPTENNVWGATFGRGTFVKCFKKVRKAKIYCENPYERLNDLRGNRYSKYTGRERIEGNLVKDFGALESTNRAALLRCHSSEDLSFLPDKSVDAVVTDPPYFDNVQYSELADFFYVWLRLALKDAFPWFEPELSGRPDEIVKNDNLGKTTSFFNEGLSRVFAGCHRVLKDDGLLVFTFHHNKIWAWEGITQALLDAGFYVSATPIVRSEGRGEVHSSAGNIRYDCILVCRKNVGGNHLENYEPASLKGQILSDAVLWAKRTLESEMPLGTVDVFTIVMGKTVEYYTKVIANNGAISGIDLKGLLMDMADLVSHIDTPVGRERREQVHEDKVEQLALFVMESKAKYRS